MNLAWLVQKIVNIKPKMRIVKVMGKKC